MSALDYLLQSYRQAAITEREKGTYFERLVVAFMRNDPVQSQQYSEVWPFADWAKANGLDGRDTGIDLVAKLANDDGYAAVQCKFYAASYRIQKKDVDGFLSASSTKHFVRRVFIDTTEQDWSENAEATIANQVIPVVRIGLEGLRESAIDWNTFGATEQVVLQPKKQPRQHQIDALAAVEAGFAENDRGKLIMACGTGKTFTALKIAERLAGKGKRVLFLVPSLALISQTVREWTKDAELELRSFAVCSDAQVGKRRKDTDDVAEIAVHELDFPATTDPVKLAAKAGTQDPERMTVVFGTYQSIPAVTAAQAAGLQAFDLIICDEAHRTTGAKISGEDESNFIRVHDNKHVQGAKRLYMTATPRIYGENARVKAAEASVELCDMDDATLYGPTFFTRGFSWAVENGMLSDYKVIVLAMDEALVSRGVQSRLAQDNELQLDDATKIVGCYKALLKQGGGEDFAVDAQPMRRAIAFCKDIRSSKLIAREFGAVVDEFNGVSVIDDEAAGHTSCDVRHVDGTFNAKTRGELLHWLGDDVAERQIKILSNARCLSEGVDVAALDAILFLHPRKSQIDVVQSVGRVMRRAEGKKLGYVILPVVIPANKTPEQALDDNENYRVVWQILNALRAHDDRFDATINKLELTNDTGGQIEVIAVAQNIPAQRTQAESAGLGKGGAGDDEDKTTDRTEEQLNFILDEFPAAIRAKIVQKCGRRTYWEDWATDIGKIAQQHIERIRAILDTGTDERAVFDEFLAEIRDDLNGAVTEDEAIEMLAQHLITKPVFDALFEDYDFAANNPVSQAMQKVVAVLEPKNIQKEAAELENFYASVRRRATGISSADGKQKIVVELYEKFFKNAFPKLSAKLGIVYTPVEVVDFIIHSVNDILQQEFGQTLGSKNVHIIDPFTGTGTFVTRLLQSGLIDAADLEYKYKNEIHANEIVLLAYYIAAINIEATYHSLSGKDYTPFTGICLTDTFEMYESDDMVAALMADNSERRSKQKALDIRVIIGNPPYSAGQKSENDTAKNVKYPLLDERLRETFVKKSSQKIGKKSAYDSYLRAIRWAADRIENDGIVGYISGSNFIDKYAMDGVRRALHDEFSKIYVINLRGDIRKNMLSKGLAGEGANVFGSASMTGIAVVFLVKNSMHVGRCEIEYLDIGENLDRNAKLSKINFWKSLGWMKDQGLMSSLTPDDHGDWINHRNQSFVDMLIIGEKSIGQQEKIFSFFTSGVNTARDAWCYNFSKISLAENMRETISFYNDQVGEYQAAKSNGRNGARVDVDDIISADMKRISWGTNLKAGVKAGRKIEFDTAALRKSVYRPFTKQWLYFSKAMTHSLYRQPTAYPNDEVKQFGFCLSGIGARSGFSVLMVDQVPNFDTVEKGPFFSRFEYVEDAQANGIDLFASENLGARYKVKDGITDYGLKHFIGTYSNASITKDDIFYYVYGLLHSEEYRERFADNLSKDLPRIPAVKNEADFWAFAEAGRKLGDLHVNYETVEPYPVTVAEGDLRLAHIADPLSYYRVEQMRYGGKRGSDKTVLHYNNNITLTNIPLAAYDYVVNGKPALDWVVERQRVKTDKDSGIVNDANDYANETMNNPAYPLELFQRVITVSLETVKIVRSLPKLEL
jgi:predicted helicase